MRSARLKEYTLAFLHLLGTGSGRINPERKASSYLLETDSGDVLLDAGEPVSLTLAARGYAWSRMCGLVVTHTHADHTGGVPMLMQQLYLSGRTTPLAVYAPAEYAEGFLGLLRLHYLFPEAFTFEVSVHELRVDSAFDICGTQILPSATAHLKPAKERLLALGYDRPCEAFALRITHAEGTLLYSGDVNSFEDIRAALEGARFAVIDSTHIDLDSVLAWAAGHPRCHIILSHIAPDFDPAALDRLLAKAGITWVQIATEGATIALQA